MKNTKISTITSATLAIAVLLVAVSVNLDLLLTGFGGRTQHAIKDTYVDYGGFNNDRCWMNSGKACEDVKVHYPSNTAFLACGNPEDRLEFYPGAGRHNSSPSRSYLEYLIKYDIDANITTRLEIENWNIQRDLVLHGLDIWEQREDPDSKEIYIYAINHERHGESIVLFSHKLGTATVRVVNEYIHPLIKTANEVAAAGPRGFFISNDHYYRKGLARTLEDKYGPFRWASSVVYCADENDKGFDCHVVSPKNSHAYANGILLIDQGRSMVVNDIVDGSVTFYDVHPETKLLTYRRTIFLGASPDNLSEVAVSGDLIISVVPNLASVYARHFGNDPLNYSAHVEAAVIRLVKARDFAQELLYWDDGSLVSILTGSAVDAKHEKLIAGGVWERHFIVCDINL